MRAVLYVLLAAALLVAPRMSVAQSIDAGRGEVPLTIPSGYSADTATPLIVLLHGFGGSGSGQDDYMKFSALADGYGFILATPDGTASEGEVFGMQKPRFWNASKACCNFGGMKVDDSTYLSDLIAAIKAEYRIDDKRVYLVGHSNGGFMSHRMARDHAAEIAAIASLAGTEDSEAPAIPAATPVHVLQIHGTADETITYGGGDIQGVGSYTGAEQTVATWASRNGCDGSGAEVGTVDLVGTLDGAESTITRFTSGCRAGGSVELWRMAEGSHVPGLSAHFTPLVIEWLMGHPKP